MASRKIAIRVECCPGYGGEQTPQRFFLGARAVQVNDVIDRWIGDDHGYFKVRGDDRAFYILRHEASGDDWELTLYQSQRLNEVQPTSA